MNKLATTGLFAGSVALLASPVAMAVDNTNIVVSPDKPSGWTNASIAGGTVTYVDGAPAGLGANSLEFKTTSENASKAVYAHSEKMALSSVSDLSYWTKQVAATSDGGAASFTLAVDLNGDGTWDTNLVYEPYWQNEGLADAAPVKAGEWQQWDVDSGMFWSSRAYGEGDKALTAGAGGAPFYSLAQLKEWYPQAQLMGIGVNVGSYNPDYTINVDGVTLNGQVYDFERAQPVDTGVPTTKEQCKKDGWKTLHNVDGRMFRNQGQCVSFVASGK